ncbi:hypothetical protein [Xanthomarina gelatinilytica]|uniref:hypothetical protein n=1 Tax=Xanthomarina gelatinilytica TaxID=1137281 RepID=UPI003AA98466
MKHILITSLFFLTVLGTKAQQKLEKISQSIKVTDQVTIDLNTNYTTIEIDTWNKDLIEIEAFVESSSLSKEELKTYLDNWKIQVEGSNHSVTITSDADNQAWAYNHQILSEQSFGALQDLEFELANMPIMDGLMESLDLANMPKMPKMPKLPELPEGMTKSDFNFEKYQKEGDAYMEKWSKEYGETYGKEYAKRMEAWAKQVESSEEMKNFQKRMEARATALEQRMEAQEQRKQAMEAREEAYRNRAKIRSNSQKPIQGSDVGMNDQKVKKTIKIKMPKKAKLNLNVRYGELIMASVIHNLKADLSHTSFLANGIDGSLTSINASYSPVTISHWNMGELKLNYVEKADLGMVNRLALSSNSSNISIGELQGNAIIDGSFGDLIIGHISAAFNNLNIVLENSKARLSLPKTDYNFQFKGTYSRLKHPKKTSDEINTSFSTGNLASDKTIVVNAKYSQVTLQ